MSWWLTVQFLVHKILEFNIQNVLPNAEYFFANDTKAELPETQ